MRRWCQPYVATRLHALSVTEGITGRQLTDRRVLDGLDGLVLHPILVRQRAGSVLGSRKRTQAGGRACRPAEGGQTEDTRGSIQ